MQFESVAYP